MYKKLNFSLKDNVIEKYLELKHFLDVLRVEIIHLYRKIIYLSIEEITKNK